MSSLCLQRLVNGWHRLMLGAIQYMLGSKFQTQTQAKEAIDNARAGLESTGRRERNVVSELLFVESEILPDIYVHRRTDTKQLKL